MKGFALFTNFNESKWTHLYLIPFKYNNHPILKANTQSYSIEIDLKMHISTPFEIKVVSPYYETAKILVLMYDILQIKVVFDRFSFSNKNNNNNNKQFFSLA